MVDGFRLVGCSWAVGCLDFLEGQGFFDSSLEGQLFHGEEFSLHPFISETADKLVQVYFVYVTMPGHMPKGGCIVGDGFPSSLVSFVEGMAVCNMG